MNPRRLSPSALKTLLLGLSLAAGLGTISVAQADPVPAPQRRPKAASMKKPVGKPTTSEKEPAKTSSAPDTEQTRASGQKDETAAKKEAASLPDPTGKPPTTPPANPKPNPPKPIPPTAPPEKADRAHIVVT